MKEMKKIIPYIVLIFVIVCSFLAGYYSHNRGTPQPETTVITVKDTTAYIAPKPVSELGLGTQTFTLPRYYFIGTAGGIARQQSPSNDTVTKSAHELYASADTIGNTYGCFASQADSTVVELPIIQRHYSEKDYDAWVSGPLNPQLDSIKVFATTSIITKREYKPPNRWHIGVSVGYGYTQRGIQPYIGVGLTYSILSF